jgi:hypothetical protein
MNRTPETHFLFNLKKNSILSAKDPSRLEGRSEADFIQVSETRSEADSIITNYFYSSFVTKSASRWKGSLFLLRGQGGARRNADHYATRRESELPRAKPLSLRKEVPYYIMMTWSREYDTSV